MATLYKVDGSIEDVRPADQRFTLTEVQSLVGGYVERVSGIRSEVLYVDEDGMAKGLPYNPAWNFVGNVLSVSTEEDMK